MSETVQNRSKSLPDPRRERCAESFASGTPIHELALAYEVSEKTIRCWMREDPVCRRIVEDIRALNVSALSGKMVAQAGEAHEELRKMIRADVERDDNMDNRIKLAAIRLQLETTLKLRMFEEYELRLRAVEEKNGLRPVETEGVAV